MFQKHRYSVEDLDGLGLDNKTKDTLINVGLYQSIKLVEVELYGNSYIPIDYPLPVRDLYLAIKLPDCEIYYIKHNEQFLNCANNLEQFLHIDSMIYDSLQNIANEGARTKRSGEYLDEQYFQACIELGKHIETLCPGTLVNESYWIDWMYFCTEGYIPSSVSKTIYENIRIGTVGSEVEGFAAELLSRIKSS